MPVVDLQKNVASKVVLDTNRSYVFEVYDPFTTINWVADAEATEPLTGWATTGAGPFTVPYGKGGALWVRTDIKTTISYSSSSPNLDAMLSRPLVPRSLPGTIGRIRSAMQNADTYVVTGDSTRSNTYNNMQTYYTHMLGKAGISVVYNARSGLDTTEWVNGIVGSTAIPESQANCIAAIPGTGASTVWEFSLGINDEASQPDAAGLFALWKAAIDPVLAAKPDVSLVLVQPVAVAASTRNDKLNDAYDLLVGEYGVHLVEVYQPMRDVYDAGNGNVFYKDSTHPTDFGSVRVVNLILSDILSDVQLSTVTLDTSHYRGYVARRVVDERFWSSSGSFSTNAAWTAFAAIDITGLPVGTQFEIFHPGNRDDVRWLSAVGETPILSESTPTSGTNPLYVYDIPAEASSALVLGVNVDSDNVSFAGDEYVRVLTPGYKGALDLTQTEINVGVGLRLT